MSRGRHRRNDDGKSSAQVRARVTQEEYRVLYLRARAEGFEVGEFSEWVRKQLGL